MNKSTGNKLSVEQLRRDQLVSVVIDDLGRALVSKILSQNGLIAINDLPPANFSSIDTLLRLYKLQELGLLTSTFEHTETSYQRVFRMTDLLTELIRTQNNLPFNI